MANTSRGGYGGRPMPLTRGSACTLEVINLDRRHTIRVQQDGYLIGYFPTVEAAVATSTGISAAYRRTQAYVMASAIAGTHPGSHASAAPARATRPRGRRLQRLSTA